MRLFHSWLTRFNTSGATRTHDSLMCSFRWCIFCISSWCTMAFKRPYSYKSSGVRSGELGGHSTVPRRPIQWSENCRSNPSRAQMPYLVYGDFESPCIWWGVQIMQLLIMHSSPLPCFVVRLRPPSILNSNSQEAQSDVSTLSTTLGHYYPFPILISYYLRYFSIYSFTHISCTFHMAVFQQSPTNYWVHIPCSPILAICLTHCSFLRLIALTIACDLCLYRSSWLRNIRRTTSACCRAHLCFPWNVLHDLARYNAYEQRGKPSAVQTTEQWYLQSVQPSWHHYEADLYYFFFNIIKPADCSNYCAQIHLL